MTSIDSPPAPVTADDRLAEAIAKETATPIDLVRSIYNDEVAALRATAKFTQYVAVLAGRRVRMRLKKH